jgi:hypothetical protein
LNIEVIKKTINEKLRSVASKEAFGWIKKLSILNPNKRDGGIFSAYLDDQDEIVMGDAVM